MPNFAKGLKRLGLVVGLPLLACWIAVEGFETGILLGLEFASKAPTDLDATPIVAREIADLYLDGWRWRYLPGLNFGATVVVAFLGLALFWVWEGFSRWDGPRPRRRSPLRTERLKLRRVVRDDAEALHAIMTDPEAMRYWDHPPHTGLDETIAFAERLVPDRKAANDAFVIERDGRVIGMLGSVQVPWVTYLMATSELGRGYAAEAMAAYATYMFSRGYTSLSVATDARNAGSIALVRRVGFREVGRSTGLFRVQDEPADAVHFLLTPDDLVEPSAEPQGATGTQGFTPPHAPLASAREP